MSNDYIKTIDKDSKATDLAISNSKFLTELYGRAMDYHGVVFEYGLPRNDNLIKNDKDYNYLKDELNIKTPKVLLYAPTFRDNYRISAYNIDMDELIKTLYNITKEEWTILVKFHPNVSNTDKIIKFSDKVINVSNYGDINELFNISDILITDYSSCMFDYMLLNRLVFLYTPDIVDFMKERNFMIDIHELPFPIANDNQELFDNIKAHYNDNVDIKYDKFNRKYGLHETGNSAKEIVNIINKVIKGV